MKKRIADLEGAELDYAVALALYPTGAFIPWNGKFWLCDPLGVALKSNDWNRVSVLQVGYSWMPSQQWNIGGPIIERERIRVQPIDMVDNWCAFTGRTERFRGPTPLIAAMRCFVASKFGEYVELPDAAS